MPRLPDDDRIRRRRLEVGRRIREARLYANLTQERLSERCGLDAKTISRYESGRQSPTVDHLLDLAEGIGVSARDLLPE